MKARRSMMLCLLCFSGLLGATVPPARAQKLQDRTPTGGANIALRTCQGGANAGVLCNNDLVCASANCFDYNLVDLTVNLRDGTGAGWNPNATQLATIEGYFGPINDALADVTDGQMALGTVALVVDNGAPNALVQVTAGTCTASGGPCVTSGDCGGGGDVCDTGGASATPAGWGAHGSMNLGIMGLQNPLAFVHEFMHLAAGVYDEYEGALDDGVDNDADGTIDECKENQSGSRCFGGANDGQPCAQAADCTGGGACRRIVCVDPGPPAGPLTAVGCLMRCCLANTGSELCHPGNHDPHQHTEQTQCVLERRPRGPTESTATDCWTQLGVEWPSVIQVPAGAPNPGPAAAPTTVTLLTPSVLDRFVAVIDRSGSMLGETPRRVDVAITATKDFVDLLSDGTEFGLASFADSTYGDPSGVAATKDFPSVPGLRSLTSATDRSDAKAAADALSTRAAGRTQIGAGLRQARSMLLESGGAITLNTTVLLLTDGLNNEPSPDPQADLDDALQLLADDAIPVFVTCIGEARNFAQCAYIADHTAGRFVDSAETASLYDAFVEFAAEAQGLGIASAAMGTPIGQGEASAPIAALVEEGVATARFVLTWTKASSDLDLVVLNPYGVQVPADQKIAASQGEFYVIADPLPGIWQLSVVGTSVSEPPERFSARAIVDHSEVSVTAGLAKSSIEWPESFLVSASPAIGSSITGCAVSAVAEKPGGSTQALELRDDGTGADSHASDGLYQAAFKDFTGGDGTYTFTVTVHCQSDTAEFHQHDDPGLGLFPTVPEIPDFRRVIRFSGTVTGVPDNLPPVADICADARAECAGSTTPVTLDGTCSYDPEGQPLSYAWTSPTGNFYDPAAATPVGDFPLGLNSADLVVQDSLGSSSEPDVALVVVADTLPPEISNVVASPEVLWPADHRLVAVGVTVDATDVCDEAASCRITSVDSNEATDGLGDGDTSPDWEITGDLTLNLRAERSGLGAGRTYTIEITCSDASGNSSRRTLSVKVPHSQRKEK